MNKFYYILRSDKTYYDLIYNSEHGMMNIAL